MARRQGRAGQYAVADERGSEGQGSSRVGHCRCGSTGTDGTFPRRFGWNRGRPARPGVARRTIPRLAHLRTPYYRPAVQTSSIKDMGPAWVHFNGSGVDADITGPLSRRGGDLMRRLPAGLGDTPKKRTASVPSLPLHQSETKDAHWAIITFGLAHTDQSTCTGNTSAGAACRRRVNAGETHCWQHARGMRQKWHSLTRNQSLLFVFAAISVITGAIALVTSVFPQFWEMSIVPNSSSSENPQVPQPHFPPRATVSPLPQAPSILIVGTASGFPGAVIDLPITFESGQQNDVCGLGFDLTFPSQLSYVWLAASGQCLDPLYGRPHNGFYLQLRKTFPDFPSGFRPERQRRRLPRVELS